MRDKIKTYLLIGLFLIISFSGVWNGITCFIQAMKCPSLTDSEIFLRIPQSFILNFKTCNA